MAEVYATLDDAKSQLDKTTTTNDAALLLLLEAATKAIDNYCHRPDGFLADSSASARIYAGNGGPIQRIHECVEITLVEVKDSPTHDDYDSWDPGDWIAFSRDPRAPDFSPLSKGKPYTGVMVSATGGESHS